MTSTPATINRDAAPVADQTTPPGVPADVAYLSKPVKHDRGIPSLDGIRAVSILIVLLSHGIDERIPGGFGVTVFFFLSGYLITTLLRQEHEKHGSVSLTKFYTRRALRIFPNAYVVLLIATALAAMGYIWSWRGPADTGPLVSWTAVLYQSLYLNNYYQIFWDNQNAAHGTGVYWSLAVEEHFYLLFPALFVVLYRYLKTNAQRVGVMLALCVAALAWRVYAFQNFAALFGLDNPARAAEYAAMYGKSIPAAIHELAHSYTYRATECRLDAIMYGCILALVGNPFLDRKWLSDTFWCYVAVPIACAVIVATLLISHDLFREAIRYTVQSIALFPIFIAAVRCHRHPMFAWLNVPALRFIGVLSYSLYLVHLIVIFNFRLWFPYATKPEKLVNGLAAIVVSFLLAVAMYWLLEKPLAKVRRRMH